VIDGRLRSGVAVAAVVMAGLVGLGACSDSDSDSAATTSPSSSSASTSAVPTTGSTAVAGDVTVRGTVLTIFSSARLLQLDPPVDGYSRVALTDDTEYRRADGSSASLADVDEGSTVEVTGAPGAEGTVIARRVVLVG
jgi:hypothetical protein